MIDDSEMIRNMGQEHYTPCLFSNTFYSGEGEGSI